jgi:hypothetical protein
LGRCRRCSQKTSGSEKIKSTQFPCQFPAPIHFRYPANHTPPREKFCVASAKLNRRTPRSARFLAGR